MGREPADPEREERAPKLIAPRERSQDLDGDGRWQELIQELEGLSLAEHLRDRVKPLLLAQVVVAEERYVLFLLRADNTRPLSPKQTLVARLLARGIGDKQAAFELGMAINTLKEQKRRVFDKLGVRSTKDLDLRLPEPPASSGSASTPGSPSRRTIREIRARADKLLARLIGVRSGRNDPPCRTAPRETPIATGLQETWKCRLRVFLKPSGRNLTPREWEVACLAACGVARKDIAEALGISWHTVKAHLTPALEKLGAASCEDLPRTLAARSGRLGSARN